MSTNESIKPTQEKVPEIVAAPPLFTYEPPPSKEHEDLRDQLTSPLLHILGCSERVLKQATAADSEEWIMNLQQIQLAAQQLFLLLNTQRQQPGSPQPVPDTVPPEVDTDLLEKYTVRSEKGSLLIVDDCASNRDLLALLLEQQGYSIEIAETGEQGLFMLQSKKFDLMLLDLALPKMNGYEVLKCIKADMELRHIPVIMLSGSDQQDTVVRCVEIGADDFLAKPFNPILLRARISACLEKKRLRDHEQAYLTELHKEQAKVEDLLLNILPKPIADRLKAGEKTIVDTFAEATVLFADLAGFTDLSTHLTAKELVTALDEIFSEFDTLVELHGLEKIKTIGDAYMVVGGLPIPRANHAHAIAEMALDMQSVISGINAKNGSNLRIRIGINTGPVIAGVIGKKKFIYDLWGDTVNVASRMESHGHPGHIQITDTTYQLIKDRFIFARRGTIEVKGRGVMQTWLIMARKPDAPHP